MLNVAHEIIRILNESSIYLLLGFTLAGLLHILMQRFPRATASLTGKGKRPVFLASLIGLPMPLCSCGVLPAALALRKNGASKGATASFLISVPETDIVSILLTLALMGPLMGVFRPAAALVTAVTAGLLVNWIDRRTKATVPVAVPQQSSGGACCHDSAPNRAGENGENTHEACCHGDEPVAAAPERERGWLVRALHFGFVEIFDDVIVQLVIGFVLAGVIVTWLPALGLENMVGDSPLLYLAMLAVGVPVYVCATASTPLAAGLIAGGISPGAAMVFLLAGPATNIAGLLVLNKQFGARVLAGYLVAIAVCSVLAGAILDRLIGPGFTLPVAAVEHVHDTASPLQLASTILLVTLAAVSITRSKVVPFFLRQAKQTAGD
jgi:uncharacterized membrane protein YraQ (UPF0718 family)